MSQPTPPSVETVLICEGVNPPPGDTEEEQQSAYFEAWQELINSGLAWQLQGWFGRTAMIYIESGHCIAPDGFKAPGSYPSDR